MTEEMGWQLSAIDNKKTVQVGVFRLDDRPGKKPNKVTLIPQLKMVS